MAPRSSRLVAGLLLAIVGFAAAAAAALDGSPTRSAAGAGEPGTHAPSQAAALKDGCFHATMPAWVIGDEGSPERDVTLFGQAEVRSLDAGRLVAIILSTQLVESGVPWSATFTLPQAMGSRPGEYRWRSLAEAGDEGVLALQIRQGTRTFGSLAGGSITIDSVAHGRAAGRADVTVQARRTGRLRATFRAVRGGAVAHFRECLDATDPRAQVPDPSAVDAGEFEGTVSPAVTAQHTLADTLRFSGPATVGMQADASGLTNGRLQPLTLCDAAQGISVEIKPAAGQASVTVKRGDYTLTRGLAPLITGGATPVGSGPYLWFSTDGASITGAVHMSADTPLAYRKDGVLSGGTHTVTFTATFRAVSFDERARVLAGRRELNQMSVKERHRVLRQARCGVDAAP